MSQYATVDELREEGVSQDISDPQLLRLIERASALIEVYTKRWFYPKELVLALDGTGSDMLQIGPPIIAITSLRVVSPLYISVPLGGDVIDPTSFLVYNRHMQGLTDPDDRCNPKIQYVTGWSGTRRAPDIFPSGFFPPGVQNVQIEGLFGWTDPDEGVTLWPNTVIPVGKTPDLIKVACMMLVVRDLLPLGDLQGRTEQALAGTVSQERTRDQSVTYGTSSKGVISTGSGVINNAEVRAILAPFVKGTRLGAV